MWHFIIIYVDTQEFEASEPCRLIDYQWLIRSFVQPCVHYHLLVLSMLRWRLSLQHHVTRLSTSLSLGAIFSPLVIRLVIVVSSENVRIADLCETSCR